MGELRIPPPARLVMGALWADEEDVIRARDLLEKDLGRPDLASESFPFTHTSYYAEELGKDLTRSFWAFPGLYPRGGLVEAKLASNRTERATAKGGRRTVNLDPGLLSLESLQLATTKGRSHRVYLGKGIWAEVTLSYAKGGYSVQPWTYPDYADPRARDFFLRVREALRREMGKKDG